jgi:hypothetical protein
MFRRSFLRHESPTRRLDLMIQARLAELRSEPQPPERLVGSRGLATAGSATTLSGLGGLP